MKPYDFYKHKFKLKDPEKERKIKYNLNDNYDFPFFTGKDFEDKTLNMAVLNNESEFIPSDNIIFSMQEEALTHVFQKIKNNLGDDAENIANFIKEAGEQSQAMLKDYSKLKESQTNFNKVVKDLKNEYWEKDKKGKPLKAKVFNALNAADYQTCKRYLKDLYKTNEELKDSFNTFLKTARTYGYNKTAIDTWSKLKNAKNKLNKEMSRINYLKKLPNGPDFIKEFNDLIKKDSINSYQHAIDSSVDFFSGSIGEYVTYVVFTHMIQEHKKKGKEWLGLVNVGSVHENTVQDGKNTTSQLRVDHIIITEENKDLNINLQIIGENNERIEIKGAHNKKMGTTISTKLQDLSASLTQLEKQVKNSGIKGTIVISNWGDLIKSNKLSGYTVQSKFRQNPNSILNDSAVSKYSINELISETIRMPDRFYIYANFLDLFVRWYKTSEKYWKPYTDETFSSRVLASYSSEKPATQVYGRYFNYLLSRSEAIEKIYGPSLFWYMTTGGGFSLEQYIENKKNQARNGVYALLSARSPVDISQPDKPITINISHLSPTYKRDKRNPNNK